MPPPPTITTERSAEPTDIDGAGPAVPRRRTIPGGRAVLGGLLVAGAMLGVLATLSNADDGRRGWLVAAGDLTVGDRLGSGDLEPVEARLPDGLARHAFGVGSDLTGAVVIAPVAAGELVQVSDLVRRPGDDTGRTVALPLATDRAVGGALRPGDRVDVLATFGTGDGAWTETVAAGVEVLAVGDGSGPLGADGLVIALRAPDADVATALTHVGRAAEVTLVRVTGDLGAPAAGPYRPRAPEVRR